MDRYSIIEGAKDLLNLIDPQMYPETFEFLTEGVRAGFGDDSAYDIACILMNVDKPLDFPPEIVDYIGALYESEIKQGNDDAMNDLGARYYSGARGFEQDFSKAVYYYHMAAEHGNRQAQENLGYCYYYGRNVEKDYEKAFHYFALGAFDGHLISLYKIGDMYLNGYFVEKNEIEALHIYLRCLETMTDEAAPHVAGQVFLRLAHMYLEGRGTRPDAKKALRYFHYAESYLFDLVRSGDVMYKKSLKSAIEGQEQARARLLEELPDEEWGFE